jgi:FtsZ-interacting cell division protein ZipA
MNITLIILMVEVAVVCLGIVALLFYFRWKKKKNTIAEFERLLNNVSSQEEERKAYLIQHLVDGYVISGEAAAESGEYMIEAEKQFLQQFMKQQIEGSSVADFYQNLCELLNQYLYFVPSKDEDENSTAPEAAIDEQSLVEEKNNNEEEEVEESSSEQVEATKSAETDLIDEEQKNDSEEKEEEPDWGDAFSESGDEVDEATKEGFDAETKQPPAKAGGFV